MRLLHWRKRRGLKQNDVIEKIGVTVSQLSKIERGETFVTPSTAVRILELTDGEVTADDLLAQWREYQAELAGDAA